MMKLKQTFLLLLIILVGSCQTGISNPQSVGISQDYLNVATKRLHNYVDEGKLPGTYVKIIKDVGTNIYDLFKYKNIIMTSSSIKNIENRILNEKN